MSGGLYGAKSWFTRRLRLFVDFAVRRDLSPDVFTFAGILFAAVAAAGLVTGLWPVVIVGLIGRLAGANLDGAVARARGASRPFGFVLNEIGDRLGDLLPLAALVYVAVATGSMPALLLTSVATIAASLPTFVSLSVAGAGGPRLNGGPFGKTERTLTVAVTSIALAAFPAEPTLLIASTVLIAGSLLTAVTRTLTGRTLLAGGAE